MKSPDSKAGSFAEITDNSYSGNYAAQVTWKTGAVGIVDLVLDNWSEGVEVVAGQTYTLNAAVMAIEGSGLRLHVTLGFFNSTGSVINESTADWILGDSYEEKQHVGLAPTGAVNCWIAFRLFGNNSRWPTTTGITLIDNIQLWTEPVEINTIDKSFENDFSIFPNPVGDYLHIISESKINSIFIYNIQGLLLKKINENLNTVNFQEFQAGMYILHLKTKKGNLIKRIIKE